MNQERLLHLADLVETIPPEKFDLKNWTANCNTIGCAIGCATQDAWFQKQGLKLDGGGSPVFGDFQNWAAVSAFFELEPSLKFECSHEVYFLFGEDSYVTHPAHPSEVAIRVRLFVEHYGVEARVREMENA